MSSLRLSFLAHPKSPSLTQPRSTPSQTRLRSLPRCALSVISDPGQLKKSASENDNRPLPAENSRTIMELSSVGTLSTISNGGWPLGLGVEFAVDLHGTPVLCLNESYTGFFGDDLRASFHVQLDQCKMRTPQCTIQGSLNKPEDKMILKKFQSAWEKRFGEVNADLLYVVNIDRVLHVENFKEAGVWVTSADYKNATPDPLRDIAEKIVNEINSKNVEDILRFCNVYADLNFQVLDAKVIWLDRLGFDMRLKSQKEIYQVRIPFPREVTDEKGAKSSFNCMSQLAWEVEKNYTAPDFKKATELKLILTTMERRQKLDFCRSVPPPTRRFSFRQIYSSAVQFHSDINQEWIMISEKQTDEDSKLPSFSHVKLLETSETIKSELEQTDDKECEISSRNDAFFENLNVSNADKVDIQVKNFIMRRFLLAANAIALEKSTRFSRKMYESRACIESDSYEYSSIPIPPLPPSVSWLNRTLRTRFIPSGNEVKPHFEKQDDLEQKRVGSSKWTTMVKTSNIIDTIAS